jgi:hypothetical protein
MCLATLFEQLYYVPGCFNVCSWVVLEFHLVINSLMLSCVCDQKSILFICIHQEDIKMRTTQQKELDCNLNVAVTVHRVLFEEVL